MRVNGNPQLKACNGQQALNKLCGFDDANGNGIIEKLSFSKLWQSDERYKEEADINNDGKIFSAEAKYYLWSLTNITLKDKQKHPITPGDKCALRKLFIQVYDEACGKFGVSVNEKVRAALLASSTDAELDLRRDNTCDEGLWPIAEVLKANKSITCLFLTLNNIGDKGMIPLSEALKTNMILTELDLWSNNVGAKGAGYLAEALKVNKSLTKLNLWGNKLGDVGAKTLAEAIKLNKGLKTLDLGTNNISDEGAKALAEAIKNNKSLTTVYLYGNNIGLEGAKALAKAVTARAAEGIPVKIII
jgi:hypothetical protein